LSCGDGRYRVYVVELGAYDRQCSGPKGVWLYVGQTAHDPSFRFRVHRDGVRFQASRWVRKYGTELRQDLVDHVAPTWNRDTAKRLEAAVAHKLSADGYCIKGGH
jgi:Uri superfamily endonuclease